MCACVCVCVCMTLTLGVPLIAVKAITDIVDGDKPTQDEFMENLGEVVFIVSR